MKTHTEADLPPSTRDGIDASAAEAAGWVGVSTDDEPAKIVDAVDAFAFAWQCGTRPPASEIDPEDAPFALGSLWGNQLVRRFGWEWRMVTFHEHGDSVAPGVLSPDRALAVYPIHFLIGCLQNPGVDATVMLGYNMLDAGQIPDPPPGNYFNLMDGVHRLIPRLPPGPAAPPTAPAGPMSRVRKFFGRG